MKRIIPVLFISTAPFVLVISCAPINSGTNHAVLPAKTKTRSASGTAVASDGRTIFLKNCAHCHGADARGDEGPDLHDLDWTEEQIATRIRNGKKGQMTAFNGKLSPLQISDVVAYLRTLK